MPVTANASPSVSVIIPTYKGIDTLGRTLRHLHEQRYDGPIEILLAAHETDPVWPQLGALAAVSPMPARVVVSRSRLPAVKRNTAIRAATGDLLLILNDDLWLAPDAVAEHVRAHAADRGALVAVLGHIDQSPEMPRSPFTEWYTPFAYAQLRDVGPAPIPYFFFWAMNISVPRAALIEHDLFFHEQWAEIGSEDVELGWRWVHAGGSIVYAPRARGDHFHPHTLDSACRLQESIGRGLRDLEALVPDSELLERYGVFSWQSSPRAIVRGAVRRVLFNGVTVPFVKRWLEKQRRNSIVTRWLYWKVMLNYTERGYRDAGRAVAHRAPVAPGMSS